MAYSDSEKASALAALEACRGNTRAAAKFCKAHYGLNVSHEQIRQWSKGEYVHEECQEILTEKKAELADLLEALAYQIVKAMPDKVDEASLAMQATALGITIDKMRLLREQATQITDDVSQLSYDERRAEFLRLLDGGAADTGDSAAEESQAA